MTDLPPPPSGDPTTPGPPDAYGTPAEPAAYGTTETLAPPARSGRRGLAIGIGALVLVGAGGAAIWAATQLSGGGRQPDELVPKSAFAYAKVDLDPAANQKLAARSFFSKFPELKEETGDTDNIFENVLGGLLNDPELDYNRDVKPWFDKRAAVAAFPGADGKPEVIGVLRSKDDAKARASLDQLVAKARAEGETVSYELSRGYAVVGEPDGVAEALRLTANESLEDNDVYQDDIDKLDGDQVAVAWANIGEGFQAVKGEFPDIGLIPNAITDQIKGRVVAGVHLTNDYAEVQGFSIGAGGAAAQVKSGTELLTSLPSDTVAALSTTGVATALRDAGGLVNLDEMLGEYLEGSDLSFSKDVAPAIGDELVVAVGGLDLAAPRAGILSKVTEPEAAQSGGAKIAALLSFFGLQVKSDVEGDRFVLATPGDYADRLLAGDGGLATAPRFTKAMGDLKGAAFAAYVDLAAIRATPFGGEMVEEGFGSVGLVGGVNGSEGFFRLRVVAE